MGVVTAVGTDGCWVSVTRFRTEERLWVTSRMVLAPWSEYVERLTHERRARLVRQRERRDRQRELFLKSVLSARTLPSRRA